MLEKKRGSFNESALLFNEGTLQVSLPQFPPPPELIDDFYAG
jgi:hypothetical protein